MLTLEDIRALQEMSKGYVSARPWIAEADWKGEGWLIGFGRSQEDGKDWTIHTRPIPVSQCPYSDAKYDCQFAAAIVNAADDLLTLAAERLGAAFAGQQGLFEEAQNA